MNQRGRGGPPRGPRGTYTGGPRGGGHNRSQQHSSGSFSAGQGDAQMNGTDHSRGGLVSLSVRGWKNSKAADSHDGGIGKLREFLERKASPPNAPAAKITKVCIVLSIMLTSPSNLWTGAARRRCIHNIYTTRPSG